MRPAGWGLPPEQEARWRALCLRRAPAERPTKNGVELARGLNYLPPRWAWGYFQALALKGLET